MIEAKLLNINKEIMYLDTFGYTIGMTGHPYWKCISYICTDILHVSSTCFYEYCSSHYKCYKDHYKIYFYNKEDAEVVLDWIISTVTLNILAEQ